MWVTADILCIVQLIGMKALTKATKAQNATGHSIVTHFIGIQLYLIE